MKIDPTVIIDSREQDPLVFENLPAEVGCLDTGGYSIRGLTHLVAVDHAAAAALLRITPPAEKETLDKQAVMV